MGIYKTYFDKNNTIVNGTYVNTGKNPVTRLYYGEELTRFLFYCSFSEIIEKYNNKVFTLGTTKHYLKIKNTSNFDVTQKLSPGDNMVFSGIYRATSFDLELRSMKEYWDEGVGFDYQPNIFASAYPEDVTYVTEASNWYYGTSINPFLTTGGTLSQNVIATQHFDNGDEDICMDITDFVNTIIASGITTGITIGHVASGSTTGITYNYQGFCLKFTDSYEQYKFQDGNPRAVGFFSRFTQTFFDPYIETVYDDLILDDRAQFYINKINRLYLYSNINGVLTNLDIIPSCNINGKKYNVTQQTTGVYYITVAATGSTFDSYVQYNDIWSGITVNGVALSNITLKFIPKEDSDYYEIGSYISEPINYGISLSGINRDEVVPQGNIKKISVHLRKPYTVEEQDVITQLYYKIYIKQGANQIIVVDWQPINKIYNSNSFNIDTTWMIPQIYYVDIKVVRNGEINIYNEELRFTVPSTINYYK